MMKYLCLIGMFFLSLPVLAQEEEILVEEKSSSWIRIAAVVTAPRSESRSAAPARPVPPAPAATTVRPNPARTRQPAAASPRPKETFQKTNKQVGRFRKGSG